MTQPESTTLPLLVAVGLKGRISGLLAHLTLNQTFHNPHRVPLEITHIFPLPPRAAVISCRFKQGRRNLGGKLMPRRQAQQDFAKATAESRTACTLEQERPDLYTLRLGPIAPGEQTTVEIAMQLSLHLELNQAVFSFPLVCGRRYVPGRPRYGPQAGLGTTIDSDIVADASRLNPPVCQPEASESTELTLNLRLDPDGAPIERPESYSHKVKISRRQGVYWVKTKAGCQLQRDFVLRLGVRPVSRLLLDPQEATFHFTSVPRWKADPVKNPPLIIVLDRSYAMKGPPMGQAKEIAHRLVESLAPDQLFALISFAGSPLPFCPRLLPANPESKAAAREHLEKLTNQPASDLLQALNAVEALTAGPMENCNLVLITCAETADHDRLVAWATQHDQIRIHSIGVGAVINSGLLDRLSSQSGGSFRRLEHTEMIEPTCQGLLQALQGARLSDLCLVGQPLLSASPERWTLGPDEATTFHGRFVGPPAKPLQLIGTLPDGAEHVEPVHVVEQTDPAIGQSWARARLLDLEDRWLSIPVGTVDLAVAGEKRSVKAAASRLRQEAQRGQAWLERVQDFWRRKSWLLPPSDDPAATLPAVKAMEESSCMAYGSSDLLDSEEPMKRLEELARELLVVEHSTHALSLERGVLCRFTAFLAVDPRSQVEGTAHRVVVPVARVEQTLP